MEKNSQKNYVSVADAGFFQGRGRIGRHVRQKNLRYNVQPLACSPLKKCYAMLCYAMFISNVFLGFLAII